MGTMYVQSGQLSMAEPLERHALAIREYQRDTLGTGVSYMHLAMLLLGEGDMHSAREEAQSAVRLLVPEYAHLAAASSATPEEKMTALIDLSLVQGASGMSENAVSALKWALQIAHDHYPDNSLPVGYVEFLLGYAYWKGGNLRDADELMSQGVDKLTAVIGWGHPTYVKTLQSYRDFLVETKQRDKAKQVAEELERLDHSKNSFAAASGKVAVQSLSR
jgi:tetratricopeptide (TPR) repeat protein